MHLKVLVWLLATVAAVRAQSASRVSEEGVLWGVTDAYALEEAKQCIASLRAEPWNAHTEKALANHPFVRAAEKGRLPFAALRRFAGEQRLVQRRDAASFAALARVDWRPSPAGLLDLHLNAVPEDAEGLFATLLKGELAAAPLQARLALATGLDIDERGSCVAEEDEEDHFVSDPRAQSYPAFWSLLALEGDTAAAAAAAAVNFPAWGAACARIHAGLSKDKATIKNFAARGVEDVADALAFLEFFATPLPDLDAMAADVMAREFVKTGHPGCDAVRDAVRSLQFYELDFWDAVWKKGAKK